MRSALGRLALFVVIVAAQACASGQKPQPRPEDPAGWPVDPAQVVVTGEFGAPRGNSKHEGIDLAAPAGTVVRATGHGIVVTAGKDGRYGKNIVIDHGGGFRTRYAHLKKIEIKKGRRVRRGDLIGRVGKSGNASGTHLHYEVIRNGVQVNPRVYLD